MNPEVEKVLDDSDQEIAAVRAARHRISERFGHDPYRLVAHYIERQKASSATLILAPERANEAELMIGRRR